MQTAICLLHCDYPFLLGHTPPDTQDELPRASAKGPLPESSKPGTAKRQLFPDKPTDGKKSKKE